MKKVFFCTFIFFSLFFPVGCESSTKGDTQSKVISLESLCKEIGGCCQGTIPLVKKHSYLILNEPRGPTICPKQTTTEQLKCVNFCPEGTYRNMLKCRGSLKWCEPQPLSEKKRIHDIFDSLCKEADSCCQASLKIVKQQNPNLVLLSSIATCPKGTEKKDANCPTSLKWCEPDK